ncbi:MAG: transposase, partial [Pseudomonadota bacterium]
NYRVTGARRHTTMTLKTDEFIRRFLIHVLPKGQHRIRHYGFFGNGNRRDRIAMIRRLLGSETEPDQVAEEEASTGAGEEEQLQPCPKCGSPMRIIETFLRGQFPRSRAPPWEEAA